MSNFKPPRQEISVFHTIILGFCRLTPLIRSSRGDGKAEVGNPGLGETRGCELLRGSDKKLYIRTREHVKFLGRGELAAGAAEKAEVIPEYRRIDDLQASQP